MRRPGIVLAMTLVVLPAAADAKAGPTDYAPTRDGRIAYFTFGRRTARLPVVVVNGGPGFSHRYLLEGGVWQRIARTRLVVLYDQHGTGASTPLSAGVPYTTADQIDDLDAVRRTLGLARFALAGHSYGGYLSLAYTLAHPEQVERLILTDAPGPVLPHQPVLYNDVFPDRLAAAPRTEPTDAAARKKAADADIRLHLSTYFVSPRKAARYIARSDRFGYDPAVDDVVSAGSRGVDLSGRLKDIRAPTLVLNGRFDTDVPPITAWRMCAAISGARCMFFEASGHFPAVEEPARYRAAVEAFLD